MVEESPVLHVYRCYLCKFVIENTTTPKEYRIATGSFVRCPFDSEVMFYRGRKDEVSRRDDVK